MSGLGKTVADLIARARATAVDLRPTPLRPVAHFGDNPGDLKMLVYAPEALPAGSPLVVVLHGCTQSAAAYVESSGWLALADRYGFVLLCPEQVRTNNANLCFTWFDPADTARESGEAASIASMVGRVVSDHRVDPARVFITGLSAGGAMTAVMLAVYPELFTGGSIVAGLPYGAAASLPEALSAMKSTPHLSSKAWGDKVRRNAPKTGRWPKVAIWHGQDDTIVSATAADASVLQWTNVHGAGRAESVETGSPHHRLTRWRNADGAVAVESHRLLGLGHGAPIAAGGRDGCGAAAPWILEAGVSSSLEMARSWGIADVRRPETAHKPKSVPPRTDHPWEGAGRPVAVDVNAVISRALKSAGLMS